MSTNPIASTKRFLSRIDSIDPFSFVLFFGLLQIDVIVLVQMTRLHMGWHHRVGKTIQCRIYDYLVFKVFRRRSEVLGSWRGRRLLSEGSFWSGVPRPRSAGVWMPTLIFDDLTRFVGSQFAYRNYEG